MEGKEMEGMSMMKMKRLKPSERAREEYIDRLSDLPDCVLLCILNFMNTKQAVQTCVLSKRWKHLWKCLTDLNLESWHFKRVDKFDKFVCSVLSNRNASISLHSLYLSRRCHIRPGFLSRVMRYAVSHNVQQLTIQMDLIPPFIFSCRSLTFLKVTVTNPDSANLLPNSLLLPALKSLYLQNVSFTSRDSKCAEPFSTCKMLNTLVIKDCSLNTDGIVFCISNSNLSNLTICCSFGYKLREARKIVLSIPNLSSLTIQHAPIHLLSFECNLSFLEEVNIDNTETYATFHSRPQGTNLVIISWLQVLANVKIMTLSLADLYIIQKDLSYPDSMRIQPPSFVRLESLKVKMMYPRIFEPVSRAVKYLLQNSPLARADFIAYWK